MSYSSIQLTLNGTAPWDVVSGTPRVGTATNPAYINHGSYDPNQLDISTSSVISPTVVYSYRTENLAETVERLLKKHTAEEVVDEILLQVREKGEK